ncbi:O-antigen ligase family protein [Vibrio fluvialis]|nr:O-antigen ligase family protein [Vibrio fluvialis]
MTFNKIFKFICKVSIFLMLVIPIYSGIYIPPFGVVGPHKVLPIIIIIFSILYLYSSTKKLEFPKPIFTMITLQVILFLYTLVQTILLSDSSVFGQVIQYALIVLVFSAVLPCVYVNRRANIGGLFFTIFFAIICIIFISIIESFIGMSLAPYLSVDSTDFIKEISLGKFRSDEYRIMAVFTNSLVLSQFIVFSLPLVLYYLNRHNTNKFLTIMVYSIFLYLQVLTASRTGIMLVLLTPILYVFLNINLKSEARYSKLITSLTFIGLIFFAYISPLLIEMYALSTYSYGEKMTSALARVNQMKLIFEVAMDSPQNFLFGVGSGNGLHFMEKHFYSIDNYYLSLLLEQGLCGIMLRFFILISFVKLLYRCVSLGSNFVISVLVSLFLVMIAYSTLSIGFGVIFICILYLLTLEYYFSEEKDVSLN